MAGQPQLKVPGPMSKIPPQQPPPPAGGMHGNPVGGPKPGMGMPPQGVHGIPELRSVSAETCSSS